jgi:hypothetical protein
MAIKRLLTTHTYPLLLLSDHLAAAATVRRAGNMGKEPLPAPEGTRPMMISMREMETLGLKTGSGLRETVPYKLLDKTAVLEQVAQVGFMSPFHEFRAELAKLAGDEILIIADPTETYGENWLLCLTRRALEAQLDDIREREDRDAREAKERERESSADGHDDVASLEYEDRPVVPRAWESATARETHEDVEALAVKPSRPLVRPPLYTGDDSVPGLRCQWMVMVTRSSCRSPRCRTSSTPTTSSATGTLTSVRFPCCPFVIVMCLTSHV